MARLDVTVADGKYRVIVDDDGRLSALRDGKPWGRDLVGDQLVLALATDLSDTRRHLAFLMSAGTPTAFPYTRLV